MFILKRRQGQIFIDRGKPATLINLVIMRIGLISDTHIPYDAKELPPRLKYIFQNVDLILHAGDIYKPTVLDELNEMAPVLAARGDDDVGAIIDDERVKTEHILSVEGLTLWLVHIYHYNDWSTYELKGKDFWHRSEPPPEILVYGHTHRPAITKRGPLFRITPGSATFPGYENGLGTIGMLTIESGNIEGRIIQL